MNPTAAVLPGHPPPQLYPYIGPPARFLSSRKNRPNRSGQLEVQVVKPSEDTLGVLRGQRTNNVLSSVLSYINHILNPCFYRVRTLRTPNINFETNSVLTFGQNPYSSVFTVPRSEDRAPLSTPKEKRPPNRGAPTRGPRSEACSSRRSVRDSSLGARSAGCSRLRLIP